MRFRWRHVLHEVAAAEDPSVSPWNGGATMPATTLTRSVPHRESREGARFWLYREGLYARGRAAALVPARIVRMTCAELAVTTNFSFLHAAPRIPESW